MKNLVLAIFIFLGITESAKALPYELMPLEQEMKDITISELEQSSSYSKGSTVGTQNRAISPRLRPTESASGYLQHDETDFKSETYLPFEYFGRINKDKVEEGYLNSIATLQGRTENALNSAGGTWYQMLMFQEPTLAVSGAALLNISSSKIAEYQRDRANEITFNAARPEIAKEIMDDYEHCMASNITGSTASSLIGGYLFGGGGFGGSVEMAREICESQVSTIQFLAARGAMGMNGCEWLSIVMWGHLSMEIPFRMRAQFGDDEICPAVHETSPGGQYIAYQFSAVPPSFSTRQVWYEEYSKSVLDLQYILEQASTDNGGYLLTPYDLATINIRPGLKATQALVSAIEQGFDPLRDRPELVNWWAKEKANALIDTTCSEARIAVDESASSQATERERRRWKDRVNAVCSTLSELKKEMAEITKNQVVFEKILTEGDKAAKKFSQSALAQARSNKQRGSGSRGTWALDGGMSPKNGANDF